MTIPPGPDSIVQAVKRVHCQVSKWYQTTSETILEISFEGNGWSWSADEGLAKPVWFSGRQLPPCLCKYRKVRKKDPIEENIDADDEDDATSKRPKRSVKRKHTPNYSESDEVTFQQGTLGMTFGNSIMIDQFYE